MSSSRSMRVPVLAMLSQHRTAAGYAAASLAVLITSAYPALTRLSVTTSLSPGDLLSFRFGIGALLFAPILVARLRRITTAQWRSALPLSFLQGWGMAAFVVFGLQFGPASHAAALGPGAICAWVAIVAFVGFGVRVSSRKLAGILIIMSGIGLVVVASYEGFSLDTAMIGDAMFLTASALGAIYLVNVDKRRLDPILSATLVCTASAMVILPWHFLFGASTIASASLREIAWQMLFQGVLFGGVAFVALNCAIRLIGSQNVGVLTALVPVIGALCSLLIAEDAVSNVEWIGIATISIGVAVCSLAPRVLQSRANFKLSPQMTHPLSVSTMHVK